MRICVFLRSVCVVEVLTVRGSDRSRVCLFERFRASLYLRVCVFKDLSVC